VGSTLVHFSNNPKDSNGLIYCESKRSVSPSITAHSDGDVQNRRRGMLERVEKREKWGWSRRRGEIKVGGVVFT
jgi:hypothetical protein